MIFSWFGEDRIRRWCVARNAMPCCRSRCTVYDGISSDDRPISCNTSFVCESHVTMT